MIAKAAVPECVAERGPGDGPRCGYRCAWCFSCRESYPPGEERARATRRKLAALAERDGRRVCILTRSPLVLRDADLLREAGAAVGIAVVSLDPALGHSAEPHAPPPGRRLDLLARLRRAGVPAGLEYGPVVPRVNDRLGDLAIAAEAAARAGARWFRVWPVRVGERGVDGLVDWIRRERPHLLESFSGLLGPDGSPPSGWEARLLAMAAAVRMEQDLAAGPAAAGLRADLTRQLRLPFADEEPETGYAEGTAVRAG